MLNLWASVLLSFYLFGWFLEIVSLFFLNFDMVLETLKMLFLNLLKNLVLNFHWNCSIMKIYIIYSVPAQVPYLEKKLFLRNCSHSMRWQGFLMNQTSRTNQWNSLIFCILIQIHRKWKLKKKLLGGQALTIFIHACTYILLRCRYVLLRFRNIHMIVNMHMSSCTCFSKQATLILWFSKQPWLAFSDFLSLFLLLTLKNGKILVSFGAIFVVPI